MFGLSSINASADDKAAEITKPAKVSDKQPVETATIPSLDVQPEAKTIDVQTAADMLSSILSEARQKGIVKSRDGEQNSDNTSSPQPQGNSKQVANESQVTRCDVAEALNFSKFRHIKTLEDLEAGVSGETPDTVQAANIELAQKYISLGLGAEARAILGDYKGKDIDLLNHMSLIVDTPELQVVDPVFARYADCNNSVKILSTLEGLSETSMDLSGPNRRMLLTNLGEFPKELREIFSLRIAINAAENGQDAIAKAIWRKLDTLAREDQTLLPVEKLDQDDYLYLDALLKQDTDPSYYKAVLKHLSEKETVFRLRALKAYAAITRGNSQLSKMVEADLKDVSELQAVGSEKKAAAFELVKNRVHSGAAMEAIDTTKQYFSMQDEEYTKSAKLVTEIVSAQLTSQNSRERFSGLNDYLYDTSFYEAAGDTSDLKHDALRAAISANLPQLHSQIVEDSLSYETTPLGALLKQAAFLTDFNGGKREFETDIASLDFDEGTKVKLANIAISEKNIKLAQTFIPHLKDKSDKEAANFNVAIAKGKWSDALTEEVDTNADGELSKEILTVLNKGLSGRDKAPTRNWVNTLPDYLSDIDASLKTTKAYLTNG